MYRVLCFFIFLICFSCAKERAAIQHVKPNTFIEAPGKYISGSKQIWLKEFTDGTMIFEVGDDSNKKTLYQQSMFRPFNKHHKWVMYVDKGENIWCYNGDLQDHFVLLYNDSLKSYEERDYVKEKIEIPKQFKGELEK